MSDWLKALLKYVLSLGRRSWGIDDYPLRFKHQPDATAAGVPIPWNVQVINWWQMSGSGNTRVEAYEDLKRSLARYWSSHGFLPRPGSHVPIEFASTAGVEKFEAIARDFLPRVLDLDFDSCIITDESSLNDFGVLDSDAGRTARIKELYGIEVSDIADGNLVSIFRRIRASQRT